MPKLKIDQLFVEVPAGTTLLEAARRLGIEIPTICYRPGKPHFTSCMVCVVRDTTSGKVLPACSALADDGMAIDASSDAVRGMRKAALDLLLSDHIGDCEGPCHRVCPAHMNIPLMIRQINDMRFREALVTVKEDIALPAILGRVCPAPCEAGCRRKQIDAPVSICLLKRFVADQDLASDSPYIPPMAADSGKRVAILGAGPAGLAAAYYLRVHGHACTVYDAAAAAGGALRTEIPEGKLPRDVIDNEVHLIRQMGVDFHLETRIGDTISLDALRGAFDAVAITLGPIDAALAENLRLPYAKRGLKVNPRTFETGVEGVFAAGAVVIPTKLAVRAVGDGKDMAVAISQFLAGETVTGNPKPFNSVIGRLQDEEKMRVALEATAMERVEPVAIAEGFTHQNAVSETSRCLHCDCRKPVSCKLRAYADLYAAEQKRFSPDERRLFEQVRQHPDLFFEQGKCVSCGICVQITQEMQEPLGLSFINRGIATRIGVPFGEPLDRGLTVSAEACVRECPTGALSLRRGEDARLGDHRA